LPFDGSACPVNSGVISATNDMQVSPLLTDHSQSQILEHSLTEP
jgi:hypothetical protein